MLSRKSTLQAILGVAALAMASGGTVRAETRYVALDSPDPIQPYTNWATAAHVIQDAVDAAAAGDEIVVTNGTYDAGGRTVGTNILTNRVAVDKSLTLRSVNGPGFTIIRGASWTRCVYLTNGASLSGFTLSGGATPAWSPDTSFNAQDVEGGGVWCESELAVVSDCVVSGNSAWRGGGACQGTLSRCSIQGNQADAGMESLGGGALRCTLLDCTLVENTAFDAGGACSSRLTNCTLTGNVALVYSGGASNCTLYNCVLRGNDGYGTGGACSSTLINCTLTGNRSHRGTAGVRNSTLINCTLTGNNGWTCGGAESCTLYNCTLCGNGAMGPADAGGSTLYNCIVSNYLCSALNHSCTTLIHPYEVCPITNGLGNIITSDPLFVDRQGGNLRLQANSPCINAGCNAYVTNSTDLAGNPRIVSGTVDIGAYESQGSGSTISYAWLQQFGLATDGSADALDPDADGHTTLQEWRCGTDPTNALSVLRLLSPTRVGADVVVTWQGVAGVSYFVERSTNLSATPRFTLLATNRVGAAGTNSFIDTEAAALPSQSYRVGVNPP